MGENTKIEWATHSWNPWIGCQKVSAACDHCYAETLMDTRLGQVEWGPGKPRKRTSEANWRMPLKWNREAARTGRPVRVFCASLADVFDNAVPAEWREDLWRLIGKTPHLTWMLLTKRPENIEKMRPLSRWPDNVWLGTSAETQRWWDHRTSYLIREPAAGHKFVSVEPMLERIETRGALKYANSGIDWVIVGGESGKNARPMHPDWARAVRDACQELGVPFFIKQMTKKAAIPADLLVRQWPDVGVGSSDG